jgi:hypothetical protein
LKALQSPNFSEFRNFYLAELISCFIVPADTFDNVKGNFPIGFKIWNTSKKSTFSNAQADTYDQKGNFYGVKNILNYDDFKSINEWLITTRNRKNEIQIGFIACLGNDFQQNNVVHILNDKFQMASPRGSWVTDKNIIEVSIYLSVRKCISQSWLNDRDQFLWPKEEWQTDLEFQNDCLANTLFHSSNKISCHSFTNNWIPFTEQEVNAQTRFESHFMTDFINGKIKIERENNLFGTAENQTLKREFSAEATAVFDAGRELWKYYHKQHNVNVNASLYDIREYFQGRNEQGRMNSKSNDEKYMELIGELRNKLNFLADKIKPKIYEYEFLKE